MRPKPGTDTKLRRDALDDVRTRVTELARMIDAPASSLPTYGHTLDGARPHIEAVGSLLYFVVVERGVELVREPYSQLDKLLERIFAGVTSEMASSFEA